jgi:hypothetical protein
MEIDMAQIIQSARYIKNEQKKYFIFTGGVLVLIFGIFLIGFLLTGSRHNLFTMGAAVLTLVAAQTGTRLSKFLQYRDGEKGHADLLGKLPDPYIIWNSMILTDGKGTAFFPHVAIHEQYIVCFLDGYSQNNANSQKVLERMLERKGLKDSAIFIDIQHFQWDSATIEKSIHALLLSKDDSSNLQVELHEIIKVHSL